MWKQSQKIIHYKRKWIYSLWVFNVYVIEISWCKKYIWCIGRWRIHEKVLWILKGKSNFQGILNWILQIFHYYCRKQHKNIKNWQIVEQNLVLSLPFSLFTMTCAPCQLPQWQSFFISWTQYSASFKHRKW